MPEARRAPKGKIMIRGGSKFNIHDMNADVALGCLNVITGVSGSGKSSFMYEILYRNLQARFEMRHRTNEPINCKSFSGSEYLGRVILIDQSPIGRTPRSNPVTYTGAWTPIRRRLEPEAGVRDVFHSIDRVGVVKPAKVMARSQSRCISFRPFT